MGDPGNNGDFPSASEIAYKLSTGQAADVAKDVGTKLYSDFTSAAQRMLTAPVAPAVPSPAQATYKVVTGQAGDVAGDLFERGVWETGQFITNTTDALKRTLSATVAPDVPTATQAAYKVMTGQAAEVAGDLFERGVWETGQFVTNTADALKRTVTGPQPSALGTAEAASMFMTGRAGEVASNIAGRALWQAGQFAQQTVDSFNGTGAPATTAPASAESAADTAPKNPPPKAKGPAGPGG